MAVKWNGSRKISQEHKATVATAPDQSTGCELDSAASGPRLQHRAGTLRRKAPNPKQKGQLLNCHTQRTHNRNKVPSFLGIL